MFKRIENIVKKVIHPIQLIGESKEILKGQEELKVMLGEVLANNIKNFRKETLQNSEFKVFSQWGDDGIIQYLVNNLDIQEKTFIEFGVGNYTEANTR